MDKEKHIKISEAIKKIRELVKEGKNPKLSELKFGRIDKKTKDPAA